MDKAKSLGQVNKNANKGTVWREINTIKRWKRILKRIRKETQNKRIVFAKMRKKDIFKKYERNRIKTEMGSYEQYLRKLKKKILENITTCEELKTFVRSYQLWLE